MFKCEKSGKTTKPGEKMGKYVVKNRNKYYGTKYNPKKRKIEKINGWEIVKEINVCPDCFQQRSNQ